MNIRVSDDFIFDGKNHNQCSNVFINNNLSFDASFSSISSGSGCSSKLNKLSKSDSYNNNILKNKQSSNTRFPNMFIS